MIWNKVVVLAILASAAIDAEAATHVRRAAHQEGEQNAEERKLWFYSSSGKGKGSSKGSSTGGGGSSGGKGGSKSSSGSSGGKGSSGKGKGGSKGSSGSSGKVSALHICDILCILYLLGGTHICIL